MKNTSSLENATGALEYRLTNDALFHIVMERSEPALRGLLAALLGIQKNKILTLYVQNPIHFGETIDDKEIILDVDLLLNNNRIINIEVQVQPYSQWTNRVLFYRGNALTKNDPGKTFENLRGVTHIGILDHHLYEETEGFYSKYQLMNAATGKVFSDMLKINVLDLKRINMATEEDHASGLVYWAKLFKATSWEQVKEIATMDEAIMDAAENMYRALSDDELKSYLFRHKMYILDQGTKQHESWKKGIAEGEAKGELRLLIRLICAKLRKKHSPEDIADLLEMDPAEVEKIISAAAPFAPDYDEEKVYQALSGEEG